MINLNYPQIQKDLFEDLLPRTQEVLKRRFGLASQQKETLEAIGQKLHVTRERVRQIEDAGLDKLRQKGTRKLQPVAENFLNYLQRNGGFKREDLVLKEMGGEKYQPYVGFFLVVLPEVYRVRESDIHYPFWTITLKKVPTVEETLRNFLRKLEEIHKPLSLEEILSLGLQNDQAFMMSCLEAAKSIEPNWEGFYGLINWPEINPRHLRDKIYLVFQKEEKPVHFSQVTELVNQLSKEIPLLSNQRPALAQTIHNELIRDERFVLVGRGTYALREWGYRPGTVKEVIRNVLKEKSSPLSKEEIIEKVLQQRLVRKATILLNLSREKEFEKLADGRYRLI